MAEERRKGPSDRRRARGAKTGDAADPRVTPAPAPPSEGRQRKSSPNDASSQADALEESLRALQEEERGEVF